MTAIIPTSIDVNQRNDSTASALISARPQCAKFAGLMCQKLVLYKSINVTLLGTRSVLYNLIYLFIDIYIYLFVTAHYTIK